MTEDIDTLLTIAEIAGVFVGFAALVTIVAGRSQDKSRSGDTFLLFHVVITSAQVIAAALVPVVLHRYGLSPSIVWQASAAIGFLLNWLVIVMMSRVTQGYTTVHSSRRAWSIVGWSLEPLVQVPLLLCIFGLWRTLAPAFYLTAVVVLVFQVINLFAGLVTSLMGQSRE
jgi:hypothetical protein